LTEKKVNMGKKQPSIEGHVSGQANEPLTKPAHALTFQEVVEQTKCNPDDGLMTSEAKSRLEKHGNNDLGEDGGVSPGKILLRQVANAMTLVSYWQYYRRQILILADSHRCHGCQFRN
jgi:Na+-exporting ATPase